MLYLTFISIGNLPKGPFQEIGAKFKKQLGPYIKFEHRIINNVSKIEKQIDNIDYAIVLDENGKLFNSQNFAKLLLAFEDNGEHITILLSDAKGFSDKIKRKAKIRLSLSPMTTTHDLAHLFFLEQLYRAMTINHNKKYHY